MDNKQLVTSIIKANQFIINYIETALINYQVNGIKHSHYEIIRLLHEHKKMSMKDIATNILKHKSTVTALIKKLIEEGYIQQSTDTFDKRKHFASLTPKGTQLKSLINSIEQKLLIHIHQHLNKQEHDAIIEILRKLIPNTESRKSTEKVLTTSNPR